MMPRLTDYPLTHQPAPDICHPPLLPHSMQAQCAAGDARCFCASRPAGYYADTSVGCQVRTAVALPAGRVHRGWLTKQWLQAGA